MKIEVNGNNYDIEIIGDKATVNGKEIPFKLNEDEIIIGGNSFCLDFIEEGEPSLMIIDGMTYVVSRGLTYSSLSKDIKVPISGKVVDVFIKVGSEVKKGQVLIVLEAMKMENQIKSHLYGKIKEIKVCKGQFVKIGEILVTFE